MRHRGQNKKSLTLSRQIHDETITSLSRQNYVMFPLGCRVCCGLIPVDFTRITQGLLTAWCTNFKVIMSSKEPKVLQSLAKFIYISLKKTRGDPHMIISKHMLDI